MLLNMEKIKDDYEQSRGRREVAKWVFAIGTLGLGALYLLLSTEIVKEGEIGLRCTAQGKMILLPPGRHSNFPWERYPVYPQSLGKEEIHLGPYTIISIHTGFVAETFNKGVLEILDAGQHLLESANHLFKSFIPIKQVTQKLHAIADYTNDNVGLTLQADVQYQINDPFKAISMVEDVQKSIVDIAEMSISQVIRSLKLADFSMAMGTTNAQDHDTKAKDGAITICNKNIEERLSNLGITLLNIGITSWTINDARLAHELGQGAVILSQTASNVTAAIREAEILAISVKAKAAAMVTEALAEAESIRIKGAALCYVSEHLGASSAGVEVYRLDRQANMIKHAKNACLFFGNAAAPLPVFNTAVPSSMLIDVTTP